MNINFNREKIFLIDQREGKHPKEMIHSPSVVFGTFKKII